MPSQRAWREAPSTARTVPDEAHGRTQRKSGTESTEAKRHRSVTQSGLELRLEGRARICASLTSVSMAMRTQD